MIISHKYKFVFIGLPFSASSAITKELCEKYHGKPLLRKHSLYHEFENIATKDEKKYFVFAVLRNPMEIAITTYEKMKANEKGNFTNPKLFTENGGHINKKQRNKYKFIVEKNATFQEFFLKFYKLPYDNFASLTFQNCNYIIRYENIEKEYKKALEMAGIKNPRSLPVENKTSNKKSNTNLYYKKEIHKRAIFVFGPFFKEYGFQFPSKWSNNTYIFSYFIYMILKIFRKWRWRYKKYSTRKSIKGSIYGDIQRKFEN